ncbi:unnamed protein product [Lathyrus sativus]|nr:unnamed protein product [Lathyrus sativus]
MSQTSDDEPTQNNEPFIPNEEVGEASDDDLQEVRMQDIFGNNDDEDIIFASTQLIYTKPISLYNPPAHMHNICMEDDETTSVFGGVIPNHKGDEIEIGMEFENKEACVRHITLNFMSTALDTLRKTSRARLRTRNYGKNLLTWLRINGGYI